MLFSLVYSITMLMVNIAISIIDGGLLWLKYLLYVLTFALYAVVVAGVSFKDGQDSIKIRQANDLERMNIIRTGEYRELNVVKEYKPWKGFVSGLASCIPLIILMLLQAIFYLINPEKPALWPGAVASYLYIIVFAFFRPNNVSFTTASQGLNYFFNLITIPVYVLIWGGAYLLGAKKQLNLLARIEEKHKKIYGEEDCE